MSGVLHPVGSESPRTYWLRRLMVMAVLVVVLAVTMALVSVAGDRQQLTEPAAAPTQSPSAAPSTPVASSAGRSPSRVASADGSPSAAGSGPASPSSTPASAIPAPSKAAAPKAAPTTPVGCAGSALRTTLQGDRSLKPKQANTFSLSLINGGPRDCILELSQAAFELKIYSGTDRIWTTRHCPSAVRTQRQTVRSEEAMEWKLTWNGRRSAPDCTNRSEIPRAGTYFATAQFKGAKPVQLRMTVTS